MSFFVTGFNLLGRYLPPLDQLSFIHILAAIARMAISLGWPRLIQAVVSTARINPFPLSFHLKKFCQVGLIWAFFAFISGSAGWVQAAQVEPSSGLTLEVIGPASVTVGETIEVQVVANVRHPAFLAINSGSTGITPWSRRLRPCQF